MRRGHVPPALLLCSVLHNKDFIASTLKPTKFERGALLEFDALHMEIKCSQRVVRV